MKRLFAILAAVILSGALVMFFSPLWFSTALGPPDPGTRLLRLGFAFGADPRQRLDVYRPEQAAGPLPVIVFSYGGAWDSGERGLYAFMGHTLAAQGYLAIVYDYRLVPEVRFPAFVEDTAGAVAWALRHAGEFGGDPRRVFLAGHSAGAYNVALAALDPGFLAHHGFSPDDIAGVAALAGPHDFLPLDDPATLAAFSQWPDLPATQPVNRVTPGAPPFLLLHGLDDTTVGPYHSQNLARALAAAGVIHRLVEYPGIGHEGLLVAMSRPLRWRAPVLEDMVLFFGELQSAPNRP